MSEKGDFFGKWFYVAWEGALVLSYVFVGGETGTALAYFFLSPTYAFFVGNRTITRNFFLTHTSQCLPKTLFTFRFEFPFV